MQEESLNEVQSLNESTESNQPRMMALDRRIFKERCKAFSEEEWQIAIRCCKTKLLRDEYFRRTETVWDVINGISDAISKVNPDMPTEDIEIVIQALNGLLKHKG